MNFAQAKAYCQRAGMFLPRPTNAAQNKKLLDNGSTWLDVLVNNILDRSESYGNWERRQRAYFTNEGNWRVIMATEKKQFYCEHRIPETCSTLFTENTELIQSGNWRISVPGYRGYSALQRNGNIFIIYSIVILEGK